VKDWQAYAIAAFAVAAGQVLRLGQKIEAGKPVTWRDLFVLCSLLPAFASLAGAAALHFGWPVWSIIVAGTSAGWVGFGTMRFVLVIAKSIGGQLMAGGDKPA
jgi:hypothetical protein